MMKKALATMKHKKLSVPIPNLSRTKVGIQLGEQTIKVIVLKKEKNNWEIKKQVVETIGEDIIKEGKVLQPEIIAIKLAELFSKNKISKKKVAIFIEEMPIFIRQMELPKMSKRELLQSLYYQAQLEIPVDIDRLTLTYSRIKEGNEEEKSLYLLLAAYKSYVDPVAEALKKVGFTITFFGTEPEALFTGLKYREIITENHQTTLLVRKETNRILHSIYVDGSLYYSRYLPFIVGQTATETIRTMVSWNGKYKDKIIKEVILLGEEDDWIKVKSSIQDFMPIDIQIIMLPNIAIFGIALNEGKEGNFYKQNALTVANNLSPMTKLALPLGMIVIITMLAVQGYTFYLQKEVNGLQTKINEPQDTIQLINEEKKLKQINTELESIVSHIKASHFDVLQQFHSISNKLTEKMAIQDFTFSKEEIRITGTARTHSAVVHFLQQLQLSKDYVDIQLNYSHNTDESIQFLIEMKQIQTGEEVL